MQELCVLILIFAENLLLKVNEQFFPLILRHSGAHLCSLPIFLHIFCYRKHLDITEFTVNCCEECLLQQAMQQIARGHKIWVKAYFLKEISVLFCENL